MSATKTPKALQEAQAEFLLRWGEFGPAWGVSRTMSQIHALRRALAGVDTLYNTYWVLRRFPVFGVFGDGAYRVRPIHVEDFARLALQVGAEDGYRVLDAVGPETWAYRDLVRMLGETIGRERPLLSVPRWAGATVAWVVGRWLGDVLLTRAEIDARMEDLLATDGPPTGTTRLSAWAGAHAATLGTQYGHELQRRARA